MLFFTLVYRKLICVSRFFSCLNEGQKALGTRYCVGSLVILALNDPSSLILLASLLATYFN